MRISDWSSDVCSSDLYAITAKIKAASRRFIMGPAATTIARCQRGSDFSVISPSLGPSGLSSGNLTYPPIRLGDNRHSVPRFSGEIAILPSSGERRVGYELDGSCRTGWVTGN